MNEKPRNPKESLFNITLLKEIIISGTIIGIIVFAVWSFLINILKIEVVYARSYIMLLMVLIQNVHVFNCRSEENSVFNIPIKNNYLIVVGVIISVLLHFLVMNVDFLSKFLKISNVPVIGIIILFLVSIIYLLIMEVYKNIINYIKNSKLN